MGVCAREMDCVGPGRPLGKAMSPRILAEKQFIRISQIPNKNKNCPPTRSPGGFPYWSCVGPICWSHTGFCVELIHWPHIGRCVGPIYWRPVGRLVRAMGVSSFLSWRTQRKGCIPPPPGQGVLLLIHQGALLSDGRWCPMPL